MHHFGNSDKINSSIAQYCTKKGYLCIANYIDTLKFNSYVDHTLFISNIYSFFNSLKQHISFFIRLTITIHVAED